MALLRQLPREHRCAGTTHSNIPALFALPPPAYFTTLTLRRLLLYTCHSSPPPQQASQWSQQTLLKIQHWRGAMHVSSYCYTCVRILLYVCPHTAICVSSYCYISVHILLCVCPDTAICVSSYCYAVSSYCYECPLTLILLYMCPHTAMCVFSYCYICVLILLYVNSMFQCDGAALFLLL
jgi:hypothetical protein